jgi:hypothetical protein
VIGRFEAVVAELDQTLTRHEAARVSDAAATGARLTAIEGAIVRLDELEARVHSDPGERVETRIEELYKLRAIDSHAARAATEQLGELVYDLATLHAKDAQAARAAQAEAKRAAAEAAQVELELHEKLNRLVTDVEALRRQLETQAAIEEGRAREMAQARDKDSTPRMNRKPSNSGKKRSLRQTRDGSA